MEPKRYTIKCALLGESGVGKTCVLERYVNDAYSETSDPTRGAMFKAKWITPHDKKAEVKVLLWDTAGQEIYRSLASFYYKDADAIVIVYDITNKKSFESLNYWMGEVHQNAPKDCIIAIAGNKCDCIEQEQVTPEEALNFAKENNADHHLISAKEDTNIKEMFLDIVFKKHPLLKPLFGYAEEQQAKIQVAEPREEQNEEKVILDNKKPIKKKRDCKC